MLGSLRIRMLVVIVIVTLTGLSLQSDHPSKKIILPAVQYIMSDSSLNQGIAHFLDNLTDDGSAPTVPAGGSTTLQKPCEFISIQNSYGWYWDKEQGKQEFFPGIGLKVQDNTLVYPILEGRVQEVTLKDGTRKLLVRHSENLFSYYGGLKEILVEEDSMVNTSTPLGKTGEWFYFECRNQDGPMNPTNLFQ
ncbi:MAG: peptidoglycan DD-metalloendopeptidase family protein [Syntrophomonadaceae bacterium]